MSVIPPPEDIARSHHFVPEWYQRRFLPSGKGEFFVLDKNPLHAIRCADGKVRPIAKPREVFPCGPHALFQRENLYAVQLPKLRPDVIERLFFGNMDEIGAKANLMFCKWPEANGHFFKPNMEIPKKFGHPSERMGEFLEYIDAQKSRTPRGLDQIKYALAKAGYLDPDNNLLMAFLIQRRAFNCTVWAECQWEILSARNSTTKFLLSDDPVTLYNRDCYPVSASCVYPHDPNPFWKGTRVVHALSPDSLLLLTHSEHVDNPSRSKAKQNRRNARSYDQVILNYMSVTNERELTGEQVANINHIIKCRAARYVASVNRDDLFPEKQASPPAWSELDRLFHTEYPTHYAKSELTIRYQDDSILHTNAFGERQRVPGWFVRQNRKSGQDI